MEEMGPAPFLGNLVNTFDGFTRTYLFQKTKRAQKRDIFQIPHASPATRDSNFTNSPGDVGGGGGRGVRGEGGGSHMNNMNRPVWYLSGVEKGWNNALFSTAEGSKQKFQTSIPDLFISGSGSPSFYDRFTLSCSASPLQNALRGTVNRSPSD